MHQDGRTEKVWKHLYKRRYKWEKEVRITMLGVKIADSAVQM